MNESFSAITTNGPNLLDMSPNRSSVVFFPLRCFLFSPCGQSPGITFLRGSCSTTLETLTGKSLYILDKRRDIIALVVGKSQGIFESGRREAGVTLSFLLLCRDTGPNSNDGRGHALV